MPRSKKYTELLIEALKDPKEAIGYLNAVLEDVRNDDSKEAQEALLLALKDIAESQGGITRLSRKTGLARESLYKTLSSRGNPRLSTITALVQALGFDFKFYIPVKR